MGHSVLLGRDSSMRFANWSYIVLPLLAADDHLVDVVHSRFSWLLRLYSGACSYIRDLSPLLQCSVRSFALWQAPIVGCFPGTPALT